MNPNEATKPLSSSGLADQLFDATLLQYKGNAREAATQVIRFLAEALVFAISRATGDDEIARKGLLKSVGDSIIAATRPHMKQ